MPKIKELMGIGVIAGGMLVGGARHAEAVDPAGGGFVFNPDTVMRVDSDGWIKIGDTISKGQQDILVMSDGNGSFLNEKGEPVAGGDGCNCWTEPYKFNDSNGSEGSELDPILRTYLKNIPISGGSQEQKNEVRGVLFEAAGKDFQVFELFRSRGVPIDLVLTDGGFSDESVSGKCNQTITGGYTISLRTRHFFPDKSLPLSFTDKIFTPSELEALRWTTILKEAYVARGAVNNYGRFEEKRLEVESWSALVQTLQSIPLTPLEARYLNEVAIPAKQYWENQ